MSIKKKRPQQGHPNCGPFKNRLYTKGHSYPLNTALSVRKSFSALSTSSCQYLTTVSCCHSLHEAVFFFSVKLLRLVGSFHCKLLLLFSIMGSPLITKTHMTTILNRRLLVFILFYTGLQIPYQFNIIFHFIPPCQVFFSLF